MTPVRHPTDIGRWVRVSRLADCDDLTVDERLTALAAAIEWVSMAQAFVVIHGPDRAAERLIEAGCPVRFDDFNEPIIYIKAATP